MAPARIFPWLDRSGRFSPLKAATLAGVMAPALWIAWQAWTHQLGANPLTEAIHQSGTWVVRLLLVTLAITPLRRIGGWPRLILVRRMVGVAAMAYALLHLGLYVASQSFSPIRVVSEIALRFYLTIGFVAVAILVALGATSLDAAIRRLGRRWNQLHRLVYLATALGIVHFFLQSKVDVSEPVVMAGFFFWLMAFRLLDRAGGERPRPLRLTGLVLLVPVLTALAEAAWYLGRNGVDPKMVLSANFSLALGPRPAVWVLIVAMIPPLIAAARPWWERQPRRVRPVRAAA
ncbi:MAG TPA: protein-methionine-sulfoxide reductase heme-binding subunit MsrQ [Geminicoccaceae bacterium]|nr:protein-methionine-sulfoxide reductase heme-binding subunit MsrQ [Geminicoccus sp.]HMU52151.1 protein-methionine-sulfoxide reductase heme-binding subunit MsrQ [Geminicoccaceae bacterium]